MSIASRLLSGLRCAASALPVPLFPLVAAIAGKASFDEVPIRRRSAADQLGINFADEKQSKQLARSILKKVSSFEGLSDEEFVRFGETESAFIDNFRDLLADVEKAKVRICNSISDWRLDANLSRATAHFVSVPRDPFSKASEKLRCS